MGKLLDLLEDKKIQQYRTDIAEFVKFMLENYLVEANNKVCSGYLESSIEKSFYDSVWGTVEISIGEILILDSPLLQRLKRIKQLGLADVLYNGANHTRFAHTLGVLQTADVMTGKIIKQLKRKKQNIPSDVLEIIRLSAIFHDVGHMFCSHAAEQFFQKNSRYSRFGDIENLRNMFKRKLGIKPSLSEIISVLIVNDDMMKQLILLAKDGLEYNHISDRNIDIFAEKTGCFILGFPYSEQYIPFSQIISGQIDADKLDYLQRDSHATGVPVAVDMSRVFQKIRVVESNKEYSLLNTSERTGSDNIFKLGIAAAATNTLDQLIVSRMMMFENVYYHQKTLTAEETLRHALNKLDRSTKGLLDSLKNILLITDEIMISSNFKITIQLVNTEYTVDEEKAEDFNRACQLLREISERRLFKRCAAFTSNNLTDIGKFESDFYKKVIENAIPEEQDRFVNCIMSEVILLKDLFKDNKFKFSRETDIILMIAPGLSTLSLNSNLAIAEKNDKDRNMEFEADSWLKSRASRKRQNYIVSYSEDRFLVYIATEMVLLREYGLLINDTSIYSYDDITNINKLKVYLEKHTDYYREYCMLMSNHFVAGYSLKVKSLVKKWKNYMITSLDTGKDENIDEAYLNMFIKQFYHFNSEIGEYDVFIDQLFVMLERMHIVSKEDIRNSFISNLKNIKKDFKLEFEDLHLCNIGGYQDSSSHMSYYINNVNEQLKTQFQVKHIQEVLKLEKNNKNIVFIEDAFCSGKQILSIFETYMGVPKKDRQTQEEHVSELDDTLKEELKRSNLIFSFVYYNANNKEKFITRLKEIGIINVYIIAPKEFPDKFFGKDLSEEQEVLKKYLRLAGEKLIKTRIYNEDGTQKETWKDDRVQNSFLGYEDAQQLIAFAWNTPTYTFTALWMRPQNDEFRWFPLFPRINK